jgi:DNA-directed RNA polymerase beta' subunit
MTSNKDMVPIFRSGILHDNIGPISKSTFEVHTEVFLGAARHADFDNMRGVSASVMMGQHGYFGTGCFGLVLDMKEMENMDSLEVESKDKTIEDIFGKFEEKGDTCSKNKIEIKNNIAAIKSEDNGACNTNDGYDIGF